MTDGDVLSEPSHPQLIFLRGIICVVAACDSLLKQAGCFLAS
jgi:hypothetical protein